MAGRVRLGGFAFQVRVVLVLLVLFLAALNLVNLAMLLRTRSAMDATERERAAAITSRVALDIGRDRLEAIAASRDPATRASADETLRRRSLRAELRGLSLLDATGRRIAGSSIPAGGPFPDLPEEARGALRSGRTVSGAAGPRGGGGGGPRAG